LLNILFVFQIKIFTVLTADEIKSIDEAGSQGAKQYTTKVILRRVAVVMFAGAVGLGICSYFGIEVL
jgi:hypothetical protein